MLRDTPAPGVDLVVTTRRGGVSQGGYASLNLGAHVGDDPLRVAENRRRLMATLGLPAHSLRLANQVHGTTVLTVTGQNLPDPPPDGDALVTREPGLLLGILTADCAPVLLADARARVVGAAHAGWRGALAGVIPACQAAMIGLGARIDQLQAWIGPCIGPEAFQVGGEVREQFLLSDIGNGVHFLPDPEPGRFRLDLAGFLRQQLITGGVAPDRIAHVNTCTFKHEADFFSHRRSSILGAGPCGRQLSAIRLV
ncbi:MAG: peptidoglycan editing factor PgeF [Magnetococcales bacterium]|nr:peptidoglycan editing factor PgeF [Magnetococcales bacterium]